MSLIFSLLNGDQSLNPGSTPTFTGVMNLKNNGTVAAGSTVTEWGDGYNHTSIITVNTTLGAIAGGAALALGKLIYTLPAGAIVMKETYMSLAITQTQGHINANTPDIGLGTTLASGANATLAAVGAATTNILAKNVAANCTGTATVDVNSPATGIIAANDHTIYVNVAASWAASGDAAALLTGSVILHWQFFQ